MCLVGGRALTLLRRADFAAADDSALHPVYNRFSVALVLSYEHDEKLSVYIQEDKLDQCRLQFLAPGEQDWTPVGRLTSASGEVPAAVVRPCAH
jgi:hypothetical protein